MTEPAMWQPDASTAGVQRDAEAIARRAKEAADEIRRGQAKAAQRAAWILGQCQPATHPYFARKGFPEEIGSVWRDERVGDLKLCIPMRVDGHLVGLQTISDQQEHERTARDGELEKVPAFEKRFIYGQRTDHATYVIDAKGIPIFCEGYATGLSVRRVLQSLRIRYKLVICFTAGNLLKVAKNHGEGVVIADFDKPSKLHPEAGGHGIAVAKASGLPYWQSDREGEDFNDVETRAGTFRASMQLKPLLMRRHERPTV